MSENKPDKDFEDAAIVCWDRAVYHAEKAQQVAEDAMRLWQLGINAVREQQAMAGAYLALGGFGSDFEAYQELGLPYDEKDLTDYPED